MDKLGRPGDQSQRKEKKESRMIFNKIYTVLEIVATIFLVARKEVKTPQRLTSEANKHTYGGWRGVLREFNIAQVIGIEDTRLNYVN